MIDLRHGDCLQVLKNLADNSVDSIVTDPPYGLSFMNKHWDYDVPSTEIWSECLRVLKPGGHLLAFAGTRTQHRMAVNIEDAGFEIRDMIAWVYGSGFPKSYNGDWGGTALKPALEPITVARKPLIGTVQANWLAHGTGGLNIDGCRVGNEMIQGGRAGRSGERTFNVSIGEKQPPHTGRWPSNLIHDGSDEVTGCFPETKGGTAVRRNSGGNTFGGENPKPPMNDLGYGDSGNVARFFYCAKASKRDRDNGNSHPTVKPTDLMRYLCRLVTPKNGIVLDPFMGSGSTGKAAKLEGFNFIGIERESDYIKIAESRIAAVNTDIIQVDNKQESLF